MSLESWKKEFYPVEAKDATSDGITATKHSLQKWRGLRQESLERHSLVKGLTSIYYETFTDDGLFEKLDIDSGSCALCKKWNFKGSCDGCPLEETLGRRCDKNLIRGGVSEYGAFRVYNDPEPMIAALEKTLERLENEDG